MSAVTVTKKYEWDMAHRLPRHEGKCRRLHGHRYVAEIDITGSVITAGAETGMVVDFYRVKQVMDATIGEWDHRTMLHDEDYIFEGATTSLIEMGVFRVPFMPTAENIALEVLRLLSAHFVVTRVRIYETPNGWAEVKA
jgi:6-pyruvoyltetrahydropterin/6-carboxytetrahydropterin synthase